MYSQCDVMRRALYLCGGLIHNSSITIRKLSDRLIQKTIRKLSDRIEGHLTKHVTSPPQTINIIDKEEKSDNLSRTRGD